MFTVLMQLVGMSGSLSDLRIVQAWLYEYRDLLTEDEAVQWWLRYEYVESHIREYFS